MEKVKSIGTNLDSKYQIQEFLLYSDHEEEKDATHTQRVVLMISNEACRALIGWESHVSTIIKSLFKTEQEEITMNLVDYYILNSDSDEDDKDQLNEKLNQIGKKFSENKSQIEIFLSLNAGLVKWWHGNLSSH